MQASETISKSIMTLMLDLDPSALTSSFSCDFASHYPIRYWTTPHEHCRTGMNREDPKSDLCILAAVSMTCCEHQASIFNLQSNKSYTGQPATPLHTHTSTSFLSPPRSFRPRQLFLKSTTPAPSSWIHSPFQSWQ